MKSPGGCQIIVIKEIRAITGLGLSEAKEVVDGVPSTIKEGLSPAEAEEIKEKIESLECTSGAAAEIELRCSEGEDIETPEVETPEVEECDVILKSPGGCKLDVIKEVKEVIGLGLKEAKEVVDGAPSTIKEGLSPAEAEEIKEKIEGLECTSGAAAEIELKCR